MYVSNHEKEIFVMVCKRTNKQLNFVEQLSILDLHQNGDRGFATAPHLNTTAGSQGTQGNQA